MASFTKILQSLRRGILQSAATDFGARNGFIYWDPRVWDPTVWDPTVWDLTVSGHRFWSSQWAHLLGYNSLVSDSLGSNSLRPPVLELAMGSFIGILQSGILQSAATDFGARNASIYRDPTVWDPTVSGHRF